MYVLLDQNIVFEALLFRKLSLEEHDCINIKNCTPESFELEWESLIQRNEKQHLKIIP